MQSYIVNNLVVNAIQMDEQFVLEDSQSTFNGQAGDYIIHENGKQRGCKKDEFEQRYSIVDEENIKKKQFQLDMIKGYIEMAEINKDIANEMSHIENEADVTLEKYYTTYK